MGQTAGKLLVRGNEAVGWGALMADCAAFFGYPISPQNETIEWFAREFPKRGKVFVQSQCETGSINMLYGGAATGVRCMTSTSSPGWGLMQETMSHLANAELPCVIVLVMRGGPGQGTTRHAQMDYTSITRGGGQGGYKNIVLAPWSVQEIHDLMQLAFYLADKYRNPVIVATDAILGQMAEPLEVTKIDLGPLPEKDWALKGTAHRTDGRRRGLQCSTGFSPTPAHPTYLHLVESLDQKFRAIKETEVRYEAYRTEDARLFLVAFGSMARVAQEAVDMARQEGLKVGLFRPITLFPFPHKELRGLAQRGKKLMVVEDNMGQMMEDVELAVAERCPIHFLGMMARHESQEQGMIFPDRVLEEMRGLYGEG